MRLRESIRLNGVITPVVVDESGGVIDGINRLRLAAELGLATVPVEVRPGLAHETKIKLAYSLNEDRRQLDAAALKKLRGQRVARVAEARRRGMSTRTIAEQEGVSQTQVVADIRKATEQGCSIAPKGGEVTGKDGKKRPARRTHGERSATPKVEPAGEAPPPQPDLFAGVEDTPAPAPAPDHVAEPPAAGVPSGDKASGTTPPATAPRVSYDPDDHEFFNRPENNLHERPVVDVEALLLRVIREYARAQAEALRSKTSGRSRKEQKAADARYDSIGQDMEIVIDRLVDIYAEDMPK
jgi:hypothetical protein